MSQIRWTDKATGLDVLTGWDRPCMMHFLVVGKDGEDPVYSNLDDPTLSHPGKMTIHDVMSKLGELGIAAPLKLRMDLKNHALNNLGNVLVNYDEE